MTVVLEFPTNKELYGLVCQAPKTVNEYMMMAFSLRTVEF